MSGFCKVEGVAVPVRSLSQVNPSTRRHGELSPTVEPRSPAKDNAAVERGTDHQEWLYLMPNPLFFGSNVGSNRCQTLCSADAPARKATILPMLRPIIAPARMSEG